MLKKKPKLNFEPLKKQALFVKKPNIKEAFVTVLYRAQCQECLSSATLCTQKMRSADYLNKWNDQVFPSMNFFLS